MDFLKNGMQDAYNKTLATAHTIGEAITPVLTESHFQERGVLTPDEFVKAGDELIHKCPTWAWSSCAAKYKRPYLPDDKQYLITRNVPCLRRVAALEGEYQADVELDGTDDDGWLATHDANAGSRSQVTEELTTIGSEGNLKADVAPVADQNNGDEDDDYLDLDDFADDDNLVGEVDLATLTIENEESEEILKTRTYDLSITYDKYYQTPRLWLYGYNESGNPLNNEEIFQDIMQDYANRTVTMEPHPHLGSQGGSHASIHPCRHADAMKNIITNLTQCGSSLRCDQYIFIFLKFIQSICPTINYDYTMGVRAT